MNVHSDITKIVGNTPLVRVNRIIDGGAEVYAKLEFYNPTSTVKDRIGISARHAMVTKVRGAFNEYSGTASVADGSASINVEISAASVDTRSADRDGHLQSPDFFDVAKFPKITFVSNSIKNSGSDKIIVDGNLTIKDVTKPLTIELFNTLSKVLPSVQVWKGDKLISEYKI